MLWGVGCKFTPQGEDSTRKGWMEVKGRGREGEREQNVAVTCRFRYIVKDWRVHLCQVASLREAKLPPAPSCSSSASNQRRLWGKFYCWMRGSLESEHLGFSWQLPCWGILNKSIKASSLEGPWKRSLGRWRFGSGRCPCVSIACPGVGCGTFEGGSERSQRPSRTRGICFRGWGMKLWGLCHLFQVPLPSVCFG